MAEVLRLQPKKVFDIGVGCGKYGALCREYLDMAHGRFERWEWQTRIDGLEGFTTYRNALWQMYNEISIARIEARVPHIKGWDLVLMIDSLEHLDKVTGMQVLTDLVANNKHVLVSVPRGLYPQGAVHGNELERHRATWYESDFHVGFTGARIQQPERSPCLIVSIRGKG
jgi:hypothetical protein